MPSPSVFGTAKIIPFPTPPRVPQVDDAPDRQALQAVTAELEALLSRQDAAEVPQDMVDLTAEPEIIPDSWSAADVEGTEAIVPSPVVDARTPPELEAQEPELDQTPALDLMVLAEPETEEVERDEELPVADNMPAEMAQDHQEAGEPESDLAAPVGSQDLTGLPLELESQLADAIGSSLTLTPAEHEAIPATTVSVAPMPKAIALAAFDIAADGGNPDGPTALVHKILLTADLPPVPEEERAPIEVAQAALEEAPLALVPQPMDDNLRLDVDVEKVDDSLTVAALTEGPETDVEWPVDPQSWPLEDTEEVGTIVDITAPVATEDELRLRADADAEDEAAAMRAIEGRPTPRALGVQSDPVEAAPTEESGEAPYDASNDGTDAAVIASAAAVASATRAAAAVVAAQSGDRPDGLSAPRHGQPDDLTHVIGILPVIEQALNRLGVYHFDQIADWSPENVAWVEGHLGLDGRVTREHWRLQARELAALAGHRELGT